MNRRRQVEGKIHGRSEYPWSRKTKGEVKGGGKRARARRRETGESEGEREGRKESIRSPVPCRA